MEVIVQNPNNITIDIDQGRSGRGIADVNLVTIGADYYLQFVFTDSTTETVGPIATVVTEVVYAEVRNAEAFTIQKGQPVYLYQAQGNLATVKLASNLGDSTSAKTLGLAAENILAGAQGLVTTQGTLDGLNTSAYAEGDTLYLGATAGTLTNVKPKAPNHLVYIGVVERSNAGAGQIYVRVQNGYELDEIHDVQINTPANGNTLIYDATTDLWKNAGITGGTSIGVVNGAGSITINAAQAIETTASPSFVGLTLSGGTANGVLYLNGSKVATSGSALTFDGSEIFKNSGGTIQYNDVRGSAAAGTRLSAGGTLGTDSFDLFQNSTAGYVFNRANTPVVFGVNNTEQMRLTSTGLGIGTSSPQNKLTVAGATPYISVFNTTAGTSGSPSFAGLRFYGFGENTGGLVASLDGGNAQSSTLGGILRFSTQPDAGGGLSERMRLDSSGNLGIGTSLPAVKLDVLGRAKVDVGAYASGYALTLAATSETARTYQIGLVSGAVGADLAIYDSTAAAQRVVLDSSGNLGIGTSSPQKKLVVSDAGASGIEFSPNDGGAQNRILSYNRSTAAYQDLLLQANEFRWGVGASGGDAMRLDSAGNFLLGTTSTDSTNKLQVAGRIGATGFANTNGQYAALSASVLQGFPTYGFAEYLLVENAANNSYGMSWHTTLAGTQAERMRLTSAGNVGIGEISPGQKLEVNGGIRVAGSATLPAALPSGVMSYESPVMRCYIGDGSGYSWAFSKRSASVTTDLMTLLDSGNLGLGVTPSASNLPTIQSAFGILSGNSQANIAANAYYNTQWNYTSTAVASLYTQTAGQHRFFTAPSGTAGNPISFTQAMTLDASGNLVLGATSASARLDVVGGSIRVNEDSIGTKIIMVRSDYAGLGPAINVTTSDPLLFLTANTERARITSGGDLLVGTQSTPNGGSNFYVAGGATILNTQTDVTTATNHIVFRNGNGNVGSISTSGSATTYSTSSDYRLKDNPQPLTGSGAFIDAIHPKTWTWKTEGTRGVGFIAHEVQAVSPSSVVGEKDAVDADGKPVMQAMEYGSAEFIANIIAELKSLRARVAALEQAA